MRKAIPFVGSLTEDTEPYDFWLTGVLAGPFWPPTRRPFRHRCGSPRAECRVGNPRRAVRRWRPRRSGACHPSELSVRWRNRRRGPREFRELSPDRRTGRLSPTSRQAPRESNLHRPFDAADIARQALVVVSPVGEFMRERCGVAFGVAERLEGRHLHEVRPFGVVGTGPAMPNRGTQRRQSKPAAMNVKQGLNITRTLPA